LPFIEGPERTLRSASRLVADREDFNVRQQTSNNEPMLARARLRMASLVTRRAARNSLNRVLTIAFLASDESSYNTVIELFSTAVKSRSRERPLSD